MIGLLKKYCSLDEIFNNTIVDVGANDGLFLSWSLPLEQESLDVLCIEGNIAHAEALRKNRRWVFIAVVSDKEEERPFYVYVSPNDASYTGMTLYSSCPRDLRAINKVHTRTLSSIFEEESIKKISLLGIDVEGNEHEVLQGLDFTRWKPPLIMVEEHFDHEGQHAATALLNEEGYIKVFQEEYNVVYCLKERV
jgi:FkbM family methyltransferase